MKRTLLHVHYNIEAPFVMARFCTKNYTDAYGVPKGA